MSKKLAHKIDNSELQWNQIFPNISVSDSLPVYYKDSQSQIVGGALKFAFLSVTTDYSFSVKWYLDHTQKHWFKFNIGPVVLMKHCTSVICTTL